MPITASDFFRPFSLKDQPSAADYAKIDPLIRSARTFSQVAHQSLYIIDYYKRGFTYVSDNPLFLCQERPETVLEQGYDFYLKHVPEEDLTLLLEVNEAGFTFFGTIPIEERMDYLISYDFHLRQQNGHLILINHKLTPLLLDQHANIWTALCIASLSSNDHSGNIRIRKRGEAELLHYDRAHKKWHKRPVVTLSDRQKEILTLSAQGLTMEQIATLLCIDITTVKYHKRNIFRILKCTKTTEAIMKAYNYKLI